MKTVSLSGLSNFIGHRIKVTSQSGNVFTGTVAASPIGPVDLLCDCCGNLLALYPNDKIEVTP